MASVYGYKILEEGITKDVTGKTTVKVKATFDLGNGKTSEVITKEGVAIASGEDLTNLDPNIGIEIATKKAHEKLKEVELKNVKKAIIEMEKEKAELERKIAKANTIKGKIEKRIEKSKEIRKEIGKTETIITEIKGNTIEMFLKGEVDLSVHGCNCGHAMHLEKRK